MVSAWRIFLGLGIMESLLYVISDGWYLPKQTNSNEGFLFFVICMYSNYGFSLAISTILHKSKVIDVNKKYRENIFALISVLLIICQIATNLWILVMLLRLGFWWSILFFIIKVWFMWKKYATNS